MFGVDLHKTTGSFDVSAVATISNQQTSNSHYTIPFIMRFNVIKK
ncbi:hypothetical protein PI23P_00670 [Polaribacter irgensii 23-P]|uniref:Uncharacterized protein n=1 Tax=Polaribacter irgensii 23-P TaxID=313594 RepID=A4C300_9FLAO|nr:hypothetical protein PI23P_00670 [Polaribacter irgensii 23-P]